MIKNEAREILESLTSGESLLRHARSVELVMESYALKLDQDVPYAWVSKGIVLGTRGLHSEALGCFDRALCIAPTASVWRLMANALSHLGRLDEARECLEKSQA